MCGTHLRERDKRVREAIDLSAVCLKQLEPTSMSGLRMRRRGSSDAMSVRALPESVVPGWLRQKCEEGQELRAQLE